MSYNDNDKRKTVNMIEIKPYVFDWIVEDANGVGEKISRHIGNLLEMLYIMGQGKSTEDITSTNPRAAAIVAYQSAQREQELRNTVRRLAALYIENPTTEGADTLAQACDASGLDYDSVVKVAEADPFSAIVAQTSGQNKIDKCIIWLIDLLREKGKINSAQLWIAANKAGYNRRMIYRVKQLMVEDTNTPYIDVMRDESNIWWYVLKNPDGTELEAKKPEAIYVAQEYEYPDAIKSFLDTARYISMKIEDESNAVGLFGNLN